MENREITCGACTVGIGAHTEGLNCRAFKYVAGAKLKNGATVIAYREKEKGDRVVLAMHEDAPYVTWRMDTEGNTFWGHYFTQDGLAHAVADFNER